MLCDGPLHLANRKSVNGGQWKANSPGALLEVWAVQHVVQLCFIRPGRPVENGLIEMFNGCLRDECLNVEWFSSLSAARQMLSQWRSQRSGQGFSYQRKC